jgi:hypothetical protein
VALKLYRHHFCGIVKREGRRGKGRGEEGCCLKGCEAVLCCVLYVCVSVFVLAPPFYSKIKQRDSFEHLFFSGQNDNENNQKRWGFTE